jgi:hypothetical protein
LPFLEGRGPALDGGRRTPPHREDHPKGGGDYPPERRGCPTGRPWLRALVEVVRKYTNTYAEVGSLLTLAA